MPPGDYSHRISAAALARRGLVQTTGRGPTWSGTITKAGRAYLDSTTGPDAPIPRQPNVSVTQQLVDDVSAAGGTIRVPQKPYYQRGGVDFRRRAVLAEQYGKMLLASSWRSARSHRTSLRCLWLTRTAGPVSGLSPSQSPNELRATTASFAGSGPGLTTTRCRGPDYPESLESSKAWSSRPSVEAIGSSSFRPRSQTATGRGGPGRTTATS